MDQLRIKPFKTTVETSLAFHRKREIMIVILLFNIVILVCLQNAILES